MSLDKALGKTAKKNIRKKTIKELTAKKNELVEHIKELEKKLLTCLGTVAGRVAAYGFSRFFPKA